MRRARVSQGLDSLHAGHKILDTLVAADVAWIDASWLWDCGCHQRGETPRNQGRRGWGRPTQRLEPGNLSRKKTSG
ncbi:hypothetical protein BDV11DRAFT_180120 [Aspergillus similis]